MEAEAIMAGPYNITLGLTGFDDVQQTGPTKNLEGGYVTYQMSMAAGNNTAPIDDVHVPKVIIQVVKYNLPVNIDSQADLEKVYDLTAKRAFPSWMDYNRDGIMIDGQWAACWQSSTFNYRFITYFKNRNVQV